MTSQFYVGDCGSTASIKLRKAYSGTQKATVRLPASIANNLSDAGKVKVGWIVYPLRIPE